ncbi:MAG: hypothetical protein PHO02_02810 [Candidatus Nanoarchaeia archaeon]|nr:hypothetical protein [Candidatus Nanoarchaeia archaeon]
MADANTKLIRNALEFARQGKDALAANMNSLNEYNRKNNPEARKSDYSLKDEKPKRLKTDFARKIQSVGDLCAEIYYQIEENPERMLELPVFDEMRSTIYMAQLQSARGINDPEKRNGGLKNIYRSIQHEIMSGLGLKDAEEQKELSLEQQIEISSMFGRRYFGI